MSPVESYLAITMDKVEEVVRCSKCKGFIPIVLMDKHGKKDGLFDANQLAIFFDCRWHTTDYERAARGWIVTIW